VLSTQASEKRALDRVEVSVLCTGVGRGRASLSPDSEAPRKRANLQRYARHRSGERQSAFVVAAAEAGAARRERAGGMGEKRFVRTVSAIVGAELSNDSGETKKRRSRH
jgi:hypothetical protein